MDPYGGSQNDGFSQKPTFCASSKEPFPMAERKSETSFQKQLFKPFYVAVLTSGSDQF
jgi:hypothetical protein